MGADSATATLEPTTVAETPADGGELVHVPETDTRKPDAEPTAEQRMAADRAAFDQATKPEQPRENGKFVKPTGKPPLDRTPADEVDDEPEAVKEPEVEEASETPEQREKLVAARRALRRDEWSQDQIEGLSAEQLLAIGTKRVAAQAKLDEKIAKLSGTKPAEDEAATKAAQEREVQEAATYAVPLPKEVLDYVTPEDAKTLTDHITQHVKRATKAAQTAADTARSELMEDRCLMIQQKLADTYPSLKGETPPPEFLAKFQQLAGQYQTDTREGLQELMQDAALIVFGKDQKAQVQQSMIEKNRATLNGQPDPKTLTAKSGRGTLSRRDVDLIAYEEAQKGHDEATTRAAIQKRIAGREVKD